MEREETEEKESVRKTEKERHEMKYKVGDKVRVRKDLKVSKEYDGMIFNDVMSQHCGETVTINEVFSRGYYRIVEYGCCWTDGMLEGLADEELTAEEATKILSEICCENELCGGCPISEAKASEFMRFGFKPCRGLPKSAESYYLCVKNGHRVMFVDSKHFTESEWPIKDARIHKNPNCKFSDKRTATEIECELVVNGLLEEVRE